MPTINQLPAATAVTANDVLPVSQNGLTRGLTVATLLNSTQPALSLAQGSLLGRVSSGLGGPEAVSLGTGVSMQAGQVVATGEDHTAFPAAADLLASDEVILNSGLTPKRIAAVKLRALFSAGSGVQIDGSGVISATGGTGAGGQGPKGDTGAQGPAGQGFAFRGAWQPGTSYSPYDVVTYLGQTYISTTAFVSGTTFNPATWTLVAAQGAAGPSGAPGAAGPTIPATASTIGAVKPGAGMAVAADGTLSLNSVSLTALGQSGATVGQLLGWTGTSWGPTTAASYTASSPVSINAGVISLAQAGAAVGQVLTWNGSAWVPVTPAPNGAPLGSATPVMDGNAAAGVATNAAREDHRHPVDSSRAPTANPVFTGSLTLPNWISSARPAVPNPGTAGLATDTGRLETYVGSGWVQYVRTSDIPAASGQLLAGSGTAGTASAVTIGTGLSLTGGTLSATTSYTLPVATASALGGVRQGAGVTIAADGTLSATGTSGVATFNTRSGAVTLTLADITTVTGTGASARTNLGLASVASSGAYADLTGTPALPAASSTAPVVDGVAAAGTATSFARADHVHPTDTSREAAANKGQANGYAGLDSTGKVPVAQLPPAVLGALNYQGVWNAATNTPPLTGGAGTKGFYYTVSTAGSTSLDGISQWLLGDHVAFNGTVWEKLDGIASEVVSVAGRTGAVTLSAGDIGGIGNIAALTGTAQGQIAYYTGSAWAVLAPGTAGQVLQTGGAGANPSWIAQSGGNYTLPPASVSTLGGVKQGSGVTIAADGTLSATGTSGVSTFNTRSGAITLTLADVTGVTGTGGSARTSLGLSAVAVSGAYSDLTGAPAIPAAATSTPTPNGLAAAGTASTFARADHVHPTDATRAPLANPAFTGSITLPTWTTSARPGSPVPGMEGFATDTARRETYTGTSWVQYVRAGDIPAASGQLLGGTAAAGTATAINVGAGLSLSGGTLSATTAASSAVSGVSIDGSTIIASAANPYQMATADRVVDVNKATGAATKILLPASPTLWVEYTIIDGKGDAGTNNITLTAASGTTINGASSFSMNANNDAISLRAVNATTWRIT